LLNFSYFHDIFPCCKCKI